MAPSKLKKPDPRHLNAERIVVKALLAGAVGFAPSQGWVRKSTLHAKLQSLGFPDFLDPEVFRGTVESLRRQGWQIELNEAGLSYRLLGFWVPAAKIQLDYIDLDRLWITRESHQEGD